MFRRKECIAMLLAGGQGSRLHVLTERTAKPAVPFGGKYRIIDFSLSNCVNSGIDTVGILTQYQPLELNDYIGNGQPWDLNRNFGGAHILPPYTKSENNMWYKGTANAVYQNLSFIERYSPDHVLVLSGDHIYKMDYSRMLAFHREKGAECTLSVHLVPEDDAPRMGIVGVDGSMRVTDFEEKPLKPRSCLASMGLYIFNRETLVRYLTEDEKNPASRNDFGRDIIPALLADGRAVYAYSFGGYWRDVGTLRSLWQANMDLLDPADPLNRNAPPGFRVYARNDAQPPSVIASCASVGHSYIAEGCVIRGKIAGSVVSTGCRIGAGASVRDSVIMPGSTIGEGAEVCRAILGEGSEIGAGALIGGGPERSISVVGGGKRIGEGQIVPAGKIC